jgi:hypothetical protein
MAYRLSGFFDARVYIFKEILIFNAGKKDRLAICV